MARTFRDRQQAGAELGAELARLGLSRPVVLALPRGGVTVGAEIARVLEAPLDVLIVRKVGAPANRELAVAAIVDGDPPDIVVNRDIAVALGLDDARIAALADRERAELARRRERYLGARQPVPLAGRTAIVVDDGIATGATVKAALRAVRRRDPAEVVLAVPVAPPEALEELGSVADRIVCLTTPRPFHALGYHYVDFTQVPDEDVIAALTEADRRVSG